MSKMTATRLWRSPDWTPEMHHACDAMEATVTAFLNASTPEETEAAKAAADGAKRSFGELLLARDKEQRPHIYRR